MFGGQGDLPGVAENALDFKEGGGLRRRNEDQVAVGQRVGDGAIKDGQIVAACGAWGVITPLNPPVDGRKFKSLPRGLKNRQAGQQAEGALQKEVAGAIQQDAALQAAQLRLRGVVRQKKIAAAQSGFHAAGVGGQGDGETGVAFGVGGQIEIAGVEEAVIHLDFQQARGALVAEIHHANEKFRPAAPVARSQSDNGLVVHPAADGNPARGSGQRGQVGGDCAVAEDSDGGVSLRCGSGGGQCQGGFPVGGGVGDLGIGNGFFQRNAVISGFGGEQGSGGISGQNQADGIVGGQSANEGEGFGFGGFKSAGKNIGGLHTGAGVKQDDNVALHFGFYQSVGAGQRQGNERQQQQLQQQQQVSTQFLPGRVGLLVLQHALPQQQA